MVTRALVVMSLVKTCVSLFFTALAARCLEVVTIHIPVFKAHFEQRLPPKQYVLLSQFDQILKVNSICFYWNLHGWKGARRLVNAGDNFQFLCPSPSRLAFSTIPMYTPGWREALWEQSVFSKNTTHRHPPAMAWTRREALSSASQLRSLNRMPNSDFSLFSVAFFLFFL